MRTMGGSSLRLAFMKFDKPALTIEEQIDLLLARGLVMNQASHQFKPDTHFDAVLNLYLFDRELRLLVMDAIERIEFIMFDSLIFIRSPVRFTIGVWCATTPN